MPLWFNPISRPPNLMLGQSSVPPPLPLPHTHTLAVLPPSSSPPQCFGYLMGEGGVVEPLFKGETFSAKGKWNTECAGHTRQYLYTNLVTVIYFPIPSHETYLGFEEPLHTTFSFSHITWCTKDLLIGCYNLCISGSLRHLFLVASAPN